MFCCPNCKKPLPKCYICLGSMGVVNPQAEIKAHLARKIPAPATAPPTPTAVATASSPAPPPPPAAAGTAAEGEEFSSSGPLLGSGGAAGGGQAADSHQNFLEARWTCLLCRLLVPGSLHLRGQWLSLQLHAAPLTRGRRTWPRCCFLFGGRGLELTRLRSGEWCGEVSSTLT
jgi:hypothetical protein